MPETPDAPDENTATSDVPTPDEPKAPDQTSQTPDEEEQKADGTKPTSEENIAPQSETESFVLLVNGMPARGLTVSYGEPLHFALQGYTGADTPVFDYATEEDAKKQVWTPITDGDCTLEPGTYRLHYGVDLDGGNWVENDNFSIVVARGTVGAPTGLTWTGSRMSWSAPTRTAQGGALDSGAVTGYSVTVSGAGKQFSPFTTEAGTCYYNNFSNNITNEGGAGLYTFTVQAIIAQDNPHYSGSVVSAPSGAYHVPRVTVTGGQGITAVTPEASFLLLAGNQEHNTQTVTATVAEGYAFAGWTGEGVTFGDANALSTAMTIDAGYSGAAELTVYANAKDAVAPTVAAFAVDENGSLTAQAQDGQTGIARYAFSTAEDAGAVVQWLVCDDGQQSFSYAPEAGGVYYFYVQDADGNITRSDNGIPVTEVMLVDYYPIEAQKDRMVFLADEGTTLPSPVCAGYLFQGWFENAELTGDPVTRTTHDTANGRKFYAKWEKETLSVPDLDDLSFVYDGQSHTLSVNLSYTGKLSYQWYKNGNTIEGANASLYEVRDVADSGKYCVHVILHDSKGNVLGEGTTNATTVTIDKRHVVIRPNDQTITFGEVLPELGVDYLSVTQDGESQPDTGLADGEIGSAVITAGTVSCAGTEPHPVGTYAITASGFTSENYDIFYAEGTLTVKPRPSSDVTAEIVYPGEDRFFVYNGTEIHPDVRVTDGASNLAEGTDYTLSYENAVNASTDAPKVVVTLCGNYSGELSLPFAIHKASFAAQTQIDESWLYGDGEIHVPSVEGNVSQGEVTYRYVPVTLDDAGNEVLGTATSVQPVNAGTYAVTAQIGETANYQAVTAESCRFTIRRRAITISTSSAEFVYDGLPHADHGYTVEGEFAPGEGFKYIIVTGAQTDVTQGVDNTAEYALNSITNPGNYDIQIVPGRLVVTSIQLPIPANAGWSTAKPGTAQWVAVSRDHLTAEYVLQLYSGTDTPLGGPVTVSGTEYDFSEAIRKDAAAQKGSSYYFTIQTIAQGDSGVNYGPSQISDLLGPVFTVCVCAEGDGNVSQATLTRDGTEVPQQELVLLNGERAQLSAAAKEGYRILGWEAGEGLVLKGNSVTAVLTASVANGWVRAVTEDLPPEILSYEAVNTEDYGVCLQFTSKDAVGLTGWRIQKTADVPAEDALWNAISETEYTGTYTPEESGEYYLFVRDTAGSVVCYSHRKAETNADGEVVYSSVPEPRGVNRITLTPGQNATGEDKVIFKAANTSITLPTVAQCGFVRDGFAFRNWSAPSGIYADGGAYGANADETLTALWTDQHFDYTVNYYYMDTDGSYPADPALTESHSVLYGTVVSTDTPILQRARTGFQLDESRMGQITVNTENLCLNLYYKRTAFNLTYRYTIPDQQETEITVPRLYGQDLSGDFREEDKPTAPGYTFVGWHFGDTGSMPTVMPAADVVATGEFIPAQATVSVRYFLQDLNGNTYSLQKDLNRELVALHGEELTLESIQPGQVEGFTYAGALASYGNAYAETTLPEGLAEAPAGAVVSGEADNGLYINLFYTRNSYEITLKVWKGSVGTDSPIYTYSWPLPYGADLTAGEVTAQDMESYHQESWLTDDGYILAAAVDWSTDTRPETMPAGDVTVTRQFIRKTHGTFRVEVWLEGETENSYTPRTFEYIGYVGTEVSVGDSETDTVKLSGFANAIPDFQYYNYLNVSDSDVTEGTVLRGTVTDTNGIFTEGGQQQEPLVLRVFYERQTMTSTITYHVQDAKGNTTKVATATKSRKWGHSYDYEALALFHGTAQWKEAYDYFTVLTGDPVSYDYCANGYVVSCNGYYQLDGVGHWPTKVYDTVASLSSSFSNKMGVASNYVNVYYTQVDTAQQYYLDVVYNARDLSHGENVDLPVTHTRDGTTYKVRVANEAYFYTDAVYHPGTGFESYPGLATYANGNQDSNGYFTYSTLDTQYEKIDETHYIAGDYIYIAVPGNPFYYGHRASYTYPGSEIGNASVTAFLDQYHQDYADDPYAAGAQVYNRGWGSSISYGDSKLTVTFRNGSVYNIYYDVNGTVCTQHQYPAGSEITEIGCSHDMFPAVEGYEIVWYREDGTRPDLPFTLNSNLRLVGKYEKVTITSTEYAYFELADHVMLGGEEVAYITRHNMADFDLTTSTQDGLTLYTYQGNIVMATREVSSESFTNIAMDTAPYGSLVPGTHYDASNPGNHLRGCVEAAGIQLDGYFKRQEHSLTIDRAIPNTNREEVTLRTGQHYTLNPPTRAGYTLSGWKLGDSEDETPLEENGTVTVTCPDSDILATAVWTPAPFTQTFVHYYQNSALGYDTALVSAMRAEKAPQTVRISGPEGEISGSLYSGGGVSFTLDGKTYYYRSAEKFADGVYHLCPENLSAVIFSAEVWQEAEVNAAQGCVNALWYDFAYAIFLSPEGKIEKLEGTDAAYENAAGMTVEYFYTLQRGLSLSLSARLVSGGNLPDGVILTGGGNDYYYSEVVTASAALPVGYDFIGWYEGNSLEGIPTFTDETFQLVITGDHSYTAAIQAKPVAVPDITVMPPPTLQYGYAASRENAVTVHAQFPEDADSANYVKSYQWYRVVDGTPVPMETDGQSAAYQIPQGWDVGEYTLQCVVTIARKDNKLEAVYTTSPVTVSVTAATMTVGCVNYQGVYDAQEHTIVLNLPDMEDGSYQIYYSEAPVTESDLTQEMLSPVAKKDAGTYTVHYYIRSLTNNYVDTTGSGTITITPKTLTIAAGTGVYHRTYDGTKLISGEVTEEGTDKYNLFQTPGIYTIQGLMSQDTYAGYVVDADAEYDDSHVLTASRLDLRNLVLVDGESGAKNPNYTFPDSYTITLSAYIDRLGLELEWENTELRYTAESQKPTAVLKTQLPEADAGKLRIVTSGEQTTAGAYSASATLELVNQSGTTQINDFFLRNGSVKYTIDKLSVTIEPVANTVEYDGQAHTLTEFVPTKDDALLKEHRLAYAEAANSAVSAGAHTITAANALILDKNGVSVTDNYDISYGTAILTIGKRPVTVSGVQASGKIYDGTTAASVSLAGVQFANAVPGDTLSLSPDAVHASFASANVGTGKTVSVTLDANALTGADAGNYELTTKELSTTASITPATIVVQVENAQTVYGEDAQFSVSLSGFAEAEDESVVNGLNNIPYTIQKGEETPAPYSRQTPAGEYRIHANVDSLTAANYIFTAKPGVLTVSQRPVTVAAADGANITKPYDGTTSAQADNSMVAFGGVEGNTASGVVNGDSIVLQSRSQRFNSPKVADANMVTLTGLSIDNANYRLDTEFFTIPGTITKVMLTVTVVNQEITYGDPKPDYTATVTGFVNGENEEVLSATKIFTCDYDPSDGNNNGVKKDGYSIFVDISSENKNYTFQKIDGTLTVKPATITITARLASLSAIYGTDKIPARSYEYSGLKNGDVFENVVSGEVTYDLGGLKADETTEVILSLPNNYSITPIVSSLKADNYTFAAQGATLTVNKYALKISGIVIEPRVYDGTAEVYDAQINLAGIQTDGLLSIDQHLFTDTDKKSLIHVTANYTGDDGKNVGTDKNVSIAIRFMSELEKRCYVNDGSQDSAEADITHRPVLIRPVNQTIHYGDPVPAFDVSYQKTIRTEGGEDPDSGLVSGETADKSHVTLSTTYTQNNSVGSYNIVASNFTGSPTAALSNYAPKYADGTLTVQKAQLETPVAAWSENTPGLATWQAVPGIGAVAVDSYTAVLFRDGAPVDKPEASFTVSGGNPLQADFAYLIHSVGPGAYTVQVTATPSEENNADFANVQSSQPGSSGSLYAANVSFQFATDPDSQAGKADPEHITINGQSSYTMIAGEENVPIFAKLKNATGYTIKSVTAGEGSALRVTGGTDEGYRNGDTYSDTVSMRTTLSSAADIALTLELEARKAELTVEVTPRPGENQASAVYGYGEDMRPVLTVKATPNDTSTAYAYSYIWELKYQNKVQHKDEHSGDTTGVDTWKFPTGMAANSSTNYYTVRCIVTATRSDNGNSYTNEAVWVNTAPYVTNVTIKRAHFEASVSMEGWKYGEPRNSPSLNYTVSDNEVIQNKGYTFWYKHENAPDESESWTTTQPTDAGSYLVRAEIPTAKNYNAFVTPSVPFTIGQVKLDTPAGLEMEPSSTAPYGQISWEEVSGVQENGNVNPASKVEVTYQVRLYKKEDTENRLIKTYNPLKERTLDITDDIQVNGSYYFTVQAMSSNTNNCLDSAESAPFTIFMTGIITATDTTPDSSFPGNTKMYDGNPVSLTATPAGKQTWYRYYDTTLAMVAAGTAVDVADTGQYICVIESDGKVYTPKAPVTITRRNVTLTSPDVQKVYDGTTLTGGEIQIGGDGFVNGEGVTFTDRVTRTDVGETGNTFSYALKSGTDSGNYSITTAVGTLKVTPRTIVQNTEFAFDPVADVTYTGAAILPTPGVTDKGLATGMDRQLVEGEDFTYSYGSNLNAGAASVTITGMGNYDGTVTIPFTILKRPVSFEGQSKEFTYDGTEHTLTEADVTITGLVEGHTASLEYSASGIEARATPYAAAITAPTAVKIFDSEGSEVQDNYAISTQAGTLTIHPSDEPWSITLDDWESTYDGTAQCSDKTPSSDVQHGATSYQYSFSENDGFKDSLADLKKTDAGTYTIYVRATNPNHSNEARATAKLTIHPKPYWVTTGSGVKVYDGTALTVAEGSVHGIVTGETYSFSTTGTVTNVSEGEVSNGYSIVWDGTAKESNYIHASDKDTLGKLKITPKSVTVRARNQSKTYGEADPTLTAEVSATVNGFQIAYTLDRQQGEDAGTYDIFVTADSSQGNGNYAVSVKNGTFTINKAAMTINVTGEQVTKVYDGTSYTATRVTFDGNGNTLFDADKIRYTAKSATSATVTNGALPIGYVDTDFYYNDNNIAATFNVADGSLTISKAAMTITVTGEQVTATYDGKEHTATRVTYKFAEGNQDLYQESQISCKNVKAAKSSAAVDKKLIGYEALDFSYANDNIDVTFDVTDGWLTINKAAMTITVTGEQVTATYDGKEHTATKVTYEFAEGNQALYQESQISCTNVKAATSSAAVDKKLIGYVPSDFSYGDNNINVTFAVTDGWLTVEPAVFAVSGTNYSGIYDGTPHGEAAVPTVTDGTTLWYSTNNGQSWTKTAPQITNVGKYTVMAKAENKNYVDATCTYTLEVTPKAVTVTAQDKSKTYGEADPTWTAEVSGPLNGDTIQWSYLRQDGENVGSYRITPVGDALQGNYSVTFKAGTLSIAQRVLKLQWNIVNAPADTPGESGSSVVYDGLDKTAVAVFTNLAVWNGTTDEVVINGYEGDTSVRDAGTYTTKITGISGGASGNYRLEDTDFQWQITRRPIGDTSRPDGYAQGITVKDLASVLYDGTEHKPEVVVTDALIPGGTALRKDTDYTVSYQANRNAGTAKVVITGTGNYEGTIEKTFLILPRVVTLQWGKDRFAYDARTKQITASITNVVPGDAVQVGSYTGNTAKNAGSYTAQATALSGASATNYTLSGAENTSHGWTITRASITVQADNKQSTAGEALLELTYSLVGTLYGSDDLGELTLATTAADKEGEYPITITVENQNPNYEITLEDGVYTLTAPLTQPTEETVQVPTTVSEPEPDKPESAEICLWHWLILLADLIFAVGLLLTMKVCKVESEEDRRKRRKRSGIGRIAAIGVLTLACIFVSSLGFCWIELPLSILSVALMSIASALLHRRKFAGNPRKPAADSV